MELKASAATDICTTRYCRISFIFCVLFFVYQRCHRNLKIKKRKKSLIFEVDERRGQRDRKDCEGLRLCCGCVSTKQERYDMHWKINQWATSVFVLWFQLQLAESFFHVYMFRPNRHIMFHPIIQSACIIPSTRWLIQHSTALNLPFPLWAVNQWINFIPPWPPSRVAKPCYSSFDNLFLILLISVIWNGPRYISPNL